MIFTYCLLLPMQLHVSGTSLPLLLNLLHCPSPTLSSLSPVSSICLIYKGNSTRVSQKSEVTNVPFNLHWGKIYALQKTEKKKVAQLK